MAESTILEVARIRKLIQTGEARRIREEAHVSEAEVAEVVGVDQGTVSRWERGDRLPRAEAALRYAKLLRRLAKVAAK